MIGHVIQRHTILLYRQPVIEFVCLFHFIFLSSIMSAKIHISARIELGFQFASALVRGFQISQQAFSQFRINPIELVVAIVQDQAAQMPCLVLQCLQGASFFISFHAQIQGGFRAPGQALHNSLSSAQCFSAAARLLYPM